MLARYKKKVDEKSEQEAKNANYQDCSQDSTETNVDVEAV